MNRDEVQAFPGFYGDHMEPHGGMTLRDWFAGQALVGQLASLSSAASVQVMSEAPDPYAWAAESAYRFADAMLAARQREVPK